MSNKTERISHHYLPHIRHAAFVEGNASGTIFDKNLVIGEYRLKG